METLAESFLGDLHAMGILQAPHIAQAHEFIKLLQQNAFNPSCSPQSKCQKFSTNETGPSTSTSSQKQEQKSNPNDFFANMIAIAQALLEPETEAEKVKKSEKNCCKSEKAETCAKNQEKDKKNETPKAEVSETSSKSVSDAKVEKNAEPTTVAKNEKTSATDLTAKNDQNGKNDNVFEMKLNVSSYATHELKVQLNEGENFVSVEGDHEDESGKMSFKKRFILPNGVKSNEMSCRIEADGTMVISVPYETSAKNPNERVILINFTKKEENKAPSAPSLGTIHQILI